MPDSTSKRPGSPGNPMQLPAAFRSVNERHPAVAEAFHALGTAIHQAGPLTERERRLVKLALAVGAKVEGGVHSNARKCLYSGIRPEEVRHVVLLGLTTLGFPSMAATYTWVEDVIRAKEAGAHDPAAAPPDDEP